MGFFAIEHGTAAYRADFALYASTVALLSAAVLASVPSSRWAEPAGLVAAGWIGWTAIEYLLHRFVLHGLMPFRRWHEEHHRRPNALICTPTILSASLVVVLVFLPTLALAGTWQACAPDARRRHGLPRLCSDPPCDAPLALRRPLAGASQALACAAPPCRVVRGLRRDERLLGPRLRQRPRCRSAVEAEIGPLIGGIAAARCRLEGARDRARSARRAGRRSPSRVEARSLPG